MRLLVLFLFRFFALGQEQDVVERFDFPAMAKQGFIDGVVKSRIGPEGIHVLGKPTEREDLLVPMAKLQLTILAALDMVPDEVLRVEQEYRIERPRGKWSFKMKQKSNSAVVIFLMRLFGEPVMSWEAQYNCIDELSQKPKNKLIVDGSVMKVIVWYQAKCLVTEPYKIFVK